MADRLNARLDEELALKLDALRRRYGLSTTDVVRRSIEHYYSVAMESGQSAAAILKSSGLIACSDGPANLSTTYKKELAGSFGAKGDKGTKSTKKPVKKK